MLKLHFSAYHEKMKKTIIQRNYFLLVWIFVTFASNSEGTKTVFYFLYCSFPVYDMKKESHIFPPFF